jgi:hypothetical protein
MQIILQVLVVPLKEAIYNIKCLKICLDLVVAHLIYHIKL